MPERYKCEVVYSEQLCEDIYLMTIINEQLAKNAKIGQFLHINCGHSRLLRRPISISSVRGGYLEFIFEVKGSGTKWLSKREKGKSIDVLGPLGNGFSLPAKDNAKIILVGGGIGAPPMLFVAEEAKDRGIAFGTILGFRDKTRVILENEFKSLCDDVTIVTDDGSYQDKGFVTTPLEVHLKNGEYDAVLACGPIPMLKAVSDICNKYNTSCQVSLEEHMGCGVGACLVCACATSNNGVDEMSRVCIEGPVFDSKCIKWNV